MFLKKIKNYYESINAVHLIQLGFFTVALVLFAYGSLSLYGFIRVKKDAFLLNKTYANTLDYSIDLERNIMRSLQSLLYYSASKDSELLRESYKFLEKADSAINDIINLKTSGHAVDLIDDYVKDINESKSKFKESVDKLSGHVEKTHREMKALSDYEEALFKSIDDHTSLLEKDSKRVAETKLMREFKELATLTRYLTYKAHSTPDQQLMKMVQTHLAEQDQLLVERKKLSPDNDLNLHFKNYKSAQSTVATLWTEEKGLHALVVETSEDLRKDAYDLAQNTVVTIFNKTDTIQEYTEYLKRGIIGVFIFSTLLVLITSFFIIKQIKLVSKTLTETTSDVVLAANGITQGNNDLSFRTQQQANSLQETASTLEEITSTIKQNSENALRASTISNGAVTVAEEGTKISTNVKTAMDQIVESSSKIASFINMIDQIAFQTNILAINAAIEAAKAGDHGKGFAVVAIEVRGLAERSANAAKEIKYLITESLDRVQGGATLVEANGQKLSEIAVKIRDVSDLVKNISMASKEQFEAVDQVNHAVNNLDSITQQNSSLVEEIASASEKMSELSNEMKDLVSRKLYVHESLTKDDGPIAKIHKLEVIEKDTYPNHSASEKEAL